MSGRSVYTFTCRMMERFVHGRDDLRRRCRARRLAVRRARRQRGGGRCRQPGLEAGAGGQGPVAAALLDSYCEERRAAARENIRQFDPQHRLHHAQVPGLARLSRCHPVAGARLSLRPRPDQQRPAVGADDACRTRRSIRPTPIPIGPAVRRPGQAMVDAPAGQWLAGRADRSGLHAARASATPGPGSGSGHDGVGRSIAAACRQRATMRGRARPI